MTTYFRSCAGLAATLLAPALAFAHGEPRTDVRVILDGVRPAVAGLTVQVFDDHLAPQIVLENRSGELLEIMDADGRPFLRIDADGVEADFASPAWYRTVSPGGAPAPKAIRDNPAEPAWRRVRAQPSWGWFDPRIEKETLHVPRELRHAEKSFVISQWSIPGRLGGKRLSIEGHFRFEPAPAGVWVARLTSAAEIAPGVRVTLSQGHPPALLLENRGPEPVTVMGAQGEPFLRIGPGGAEVNLASPTWQDQGRYRGLETDQSAGSGERWERVSSAPRYSWLEPRAISPDGTLHAWRIRVAIGDRHAEISGITEWLAADR